MSSISKASLQAMADASKSSLQSTTTGVTLTSLLKSMGVDGLFDGALVNQVKKKLIDTITIESLARCSSYPQNFVFHVVQLYARPIQEIGSHAADHDNNENDIKTQNINNAYNASQGYHHGLLILTHQSAEPIQYLLDRVEGVRFVKVNNMVESELISGHLVLIKEFESTITYSTIKRFIQNESKLVYNMVNNNCLHFVYKFMNGILNCNKWSNDFNSFWEYVRKQFKRKDIKAGKYDKERNHFKQQILQKKILMQKQIELLDNDKIRAEWKIGDKVQLESLDCNARKSWFIGEIKEFGITENELIITYTRMGKQFKITATRYWSDFIKPYVTIPSKYLDPITNKLMSNPVQIIKSGIVYDGITVQYMQTRSMNVDPITGVLMTTIYMGREKPVVLKQKELKKDIEKFKKRCKPYPYLINSFKDVDNKELWENVYERLNDMYDTKKQQQKIYKKSMVLFMNDEKGDDNVKKRNNTDKKAIVLYKEKNNKKVNKKKDLLKWDKDMMFINHTSIPIITCMGPSRIGKSFLLNELLRHKFGSLPTDREIFETSNSGNSAQTKGAWISLYGDIDNNIKRLCDIDVLQQHLSKNDHECKTQSFMLWLKENEFDSDSVCADIDTDDVKESNVFNYLNDGKYYTHLKEYVKTLMLFEKKKEIDLVFVDQMPEDDVEIWSNADVIAWFNSLNSKLNKIYPDLFQYILDHKINGKTLHKLNCINLLLNTFKMKQKDAESLIDILHKRLHNEIDQIDINEIDQMYLVDMEGLTHGVTNFTKKIFEGCYASSNVVIWYDDRVMSDSFVKLMGKLEENMKIIANSDRKPAFLYLLRNGDISVFDFGELDDDEYDKYEDEFDKYIKEHSSFEHFRKLKIFSSIHGYLLESPENLFQIRKKKRKKRQKKKEKLYYSKDTLDALIKKIKSISNKTARFANNSYILNDQINHINKDTKLSLETRIAACNSRLVWFLLNADTDNKKKLQIKNAVIKFKYNKKIVHDSFSDGLKSLEKQLRIKHLNISKSLQQRLIKNKDEIISEINNYHKLVQKSKENSIQKTIAKTVTAIASTVALSFAVVGSGGAALFAGGIAFVGGGAWFKTNKFKKPKFQKKIKPTDLDELLYFYS